MTHFLRFRAFMAAFCMTLILFLTGIGCLVADVGTRRVTRGADALPLVDLAAWAPDRLPAWMQQGAWLLSAPVRLLCRLPQAAIAIPRMQTDAATSPRLSSVAAHRGAVDSK